MIYKYYSEDRSIGSIETKLKADVYESVYGLYDCFNTKQEAFEYAINLLETEKESLLRKVNNINTSINDLVVYMGDLSL